VERFIFNFRLSPNALGEKLPVPWLVPQVISGWSVVSFCILKIQRLTVRPIPSAFGLETICCAYRCGVIDTSIGPSSPSVYIVGRNTDSSLVTLMAPRVFESAMPRIQATMGHRPGYREISVRFGDGRRLFSARVFPSGMTDKIDSKVFGSLREFVDFIKHGVSSYAKSTTPGQYSRIELRKEDAGYESMKAEIHFNQIDYDWDTAGLEFDSIVRAVGGGRYLWTFRGRTATHLEGQQAELTA
jgi:hypothetical protein